MADDNLSDKALIDGASPEARSTALKLKSLANVIATVAALVVGIGGFFKPQDQSVTKAAYQELSTAVKKLSEDNAKNHDDIVALRAYLEFTAKQAVPTGFEPFPEPPTPATSAAPRSGVGFGYGAGFSGGTGGTVRAPAQTSARVGPPPPPVPAPPPVSDAPEPVRPQAFETIVNQSK